MKSRINQNTEMMQCKKEKEQNTKLFSNAVMKFEFQLTSGLEHRNY